MVVGSLDQPGLGEIDPAKRRQLRVLSQTNPRKLLIYGLVCESTLNFGRISGGWIDFGHRWLVLVRPVTSVCRAPVAGLSKVETFQLRWLQLGPARRAPCPPRSPGGWRERRHSCPLGWLPRPTWRTRITMPTSRHHPRRKLVIFRAMSALLLTCRWRAVLHTIQSSTDYC